MSDDEEYKIIEMDLDDTHIDISCPEHVLWIHVAERAILDYAYFFDWQLHRLTILNNNFEEIANTLRFRDHLKWELDVLREFLFNQSEPWNLAWIFDHCFRGDATYLETLRARFDELHVANLHKNRKDKRLQFMIEHYRTKENIGRCPDDIIPITKMRKKFLH